MLSCLRKGVSRRKDRSLIQSWLSIFRSCRSCALAQREECLMFDKRRVYLQEYAGNIEFGDTVP